MNYTRSKYFGGTDNDGWGPVVKQKTTKRSVGTTLKKRVASEQLWRCNVCNTLVDFTYQIDHVVPLELGGPNNRANLQMLCVRCHALKTAHETERREDGAMH